MPLFLQIKIIFSLVILAFLFLSGIYLVVSLSPWLCSGIIILLLLGAMFVLQKEKISSETWNALLNFLVSHLSREKKQYHWREIYTDGITVFLMAAILFTIASPAIIKLPEYRAEQNARIESAVANGALPVAIDAFCVDKKVYFKNDSGNWVYLSVHREPLECRDKSAH